MTIFQCSKCNKNFTRKLHLDNHLNRKTTCIKSDVKIVHSDIDTIMTEVNHNKENNPIHLFKIKF